jgi:hypothetical protein
LLTPQERQLRAALGDVRLVGGLFAFLGLMPLFAVLGIGRGNRWAAQLLMFVNSVVLLGPGVWYFAASFMMRRLNRTALRQAEWVARVQLVLVPAALACSYFASTVGFDGFIFLIPAMLTVFFVPALIALLFTFRRIAGLMNQIAPDSHGFETLPVQAMPPTGVSSPPARR